MAKHKNKKPKAQFTLPQGKTPRVVERINNESASPSWHFRIMDIDGPFCPTHMDRATMLDVRSKLSDLESMTWAEILSNRDHHHPIDIDRLAPEARARLAVIRQDDVEHVYSLRLTGKQRVIGIRDGPVLRLLWWDPDHQVCPSEKKHT